MPDPNDPASYLAGLGIKPTAGGTATKPTTTTPPPPPTGWVEIMPGIAYNPSFSLDKAGTGTMVRYLGPDIGWTTPTKATPDVVAAGRGAVSTQPQQGASAVTTTKPTSTAPATGGSQILQTPTNKAGNSAAFQVPGNYIPGPSGFTAQGPFGPESAGPYDIQTAGGPILGVSTGGISHPGDMSHGLNYARILADTYGNGRPWTSGDQATDAVMAANVERARNFANGTVAPAPQPVTDPMAVRPSIPMAQSPIGQALGMGNANGMPQSPVGGAMQGMPTAVAPPMAVPSAPVAQSFTPAPVASNLPPDRAAFIAQMAPVAEAWSAKTGIPPEVYLAINGSESNFGKATSLFGVKGEGNAGSNAYATHEVVNGQNVPQTDKFANYSDPNAAYQGFHNFLAENSRYAPALAQFGQDHDAGALLQNINKAGYATDPNWANMIMGMAQDIKSALPQVTGQAAQGFDFAPVTNPVGLPPAPPTIPIAPLGPSQGRGGGAGGGGSWDNIVTNPLSPLSPQNLPGNETRINPLGGQPAAPARNLLDTPQVLSNPLNPLNPTVITSTNPSQILINPLDPMHPISVPSPVGAPAQMIGSQPSALNPQGPFDRTVSGIQMAQNIEPQPSQLNPGLGFFGQLRAANGARQQTPSFLDQARQLGGAATSPSALNPQGPYGGPPPLGAPLVPPTQSRPQQPVPVNNTPPPPVASAFTPAPAPQPQERRTPTPPDFSGATSPNYGSTGLYQSPLSGGLENVFRTDAGYVFSPGRINETESLRSPMGGNTPLMTPQGVVIQHPEDMTPAAQTQLAMANGMPNIGQTSNPGAAYAVAQFAGPNATNLNNLGFASAANLPPAATLASVAQANADAQAAQDKAAADAAAASGGGMMGDNGGTRFFAGGGSFQTPGAGGIADRLGGIESMYGGGTPARPPSTGNPAVDRYLQTLSQNHPGYAGAGIGTGSPMANSMYATQHGQGPMGITPGYHAYAQGGTFLTTSPTTFPMANGGTAVTSEYGQPEMERIDPLASGKQRVTVTPVRGYASGGTFQTDPNIAGAGLTDPLAAPATAAGTTSGGGSRTVIGDDGTGTTTAPGTTSYDAPPDTGEPAPNQNYNAPPPAAPDPNALPTPVAPSAFAGSMDTNPELPLQEGLAGRQQARDSQAYLRRAAGVPDPVGISSATPLNNLGPSQYWAPIDYTNQIQSLQQRLAALGPVTGDPTSLAFDLQAAQNGYGGNGPGQPGWTNPDPIRAAQIQQQLSNMTTAADLMSQIANLRANQPQLSGSPVPAYAQPGQNPVTPTIPDKQNPNLGMFLDALNSQSGTAKRARDPMKVAA